MSEVRAILEAARYQIVDADHWTQGADSRDENGIDIGVEGSDLPPVCWCAMGALEFVTGEDFNARKGWTDHESAATAALRVVAEIAAGHSISMSGHLPMFVTEYNDHHTHAEVIALFDAAIAAA